MRINNLLIMKMMIRLLLKLLIFLLLSACKKENTISKPLPITPEKEIEQPEIHTVGDSEENKHNIEEKATRPKHLEILYVQAASGLNYREAPKGNIINKFFLNDAVEVLEHTKIVDSVRDAGIWKKGEWLGIKKEHDTVYVFSAFLGNSFVHSDINIFFLNDFRSQAQEPIGSFVNLSEGFHTNSYIEDIHEQTEVSLIPEEKMGTDYFDLSSKNRKKFLQQLNISEEDSVFVFSLAKDSVIRFPVKKLKVMANLNIYAKGDEHISAYDYELGFKLEDTYKYEGECFAYVGENNVFQTGQIKAIIWKQIETGNFPVPFNSNMVHSSMRSWFEEMHAGKSYKFSHGNLNYFLQDLMQANRLQHRYLVVTQEGTNKVVYKDIFMDTESTSLMPLNIRGENTEYYQTQWTGAIFKEKPAMVYGFLSNSFGCPDIRFLSKTEPSIYTRCDNRH